MFVVRRRVVLELAPGELLEFCGPAGWHKVSPEGDGARRDVERAGDINAALLKMNKNIGESHVTEL